MVLKPKLKKSYWVWKLSNPRNMNINSSLYYIKTIPFNIFILHHPFLYLEKEFFYAIY